MGRIVVIGGGAAGLGAALALGRDGHEVVVLERDGTPLPDDPEDAFRGWRRPGAPQLWHSHAFLARLHRLLRERAPDALAELRTHGARELSFFDTLPPEVSRGEPQPGDEELVLLACRRVVFEWVLRRLCLHERAVEWRGGWRVLSLLADPGAPPRVRGVHALSPEGTQETLAADLVLDASGCRSKIVSWLGDLGVGVPEEDEDAGILYGSRFFRLRPGMEAPEGRGVVGADLGYMKYGIFPGDGASFSVTLAVPTGDPDLRRLLHPEVFGVAAGAFPAVGAWTDPERAEPISRVRGMGCLRNRRRHFEVDGAPIVLGLHALGDAAVCTNPLYGRGCALAFVHAFLLADALREHPQDAGDRALAFEAATERELAPWWRAARDQDRDSAEVAAAMRRGADPYQTQRADGTVDPKAFARSMLRHGFLPLLRTDIAALRAFVRTFNLLDPPDALMQNAELLPRVMASYAQREGRVEETLGPERAELVQALRTAA